MADMLQTLTETVRQRKQARQEGSYTCYLLDQGLDKILKKCAEECGEVLIAAKNGQTNDTICEIADLLYHLSVLMVAQDISAQSIADELDRRHGKTGNLKQFHTVDPNS